MSVGFPEQTMVKRDDTPVRISNAALAKIRIAAAYLGKTLSEYISDAMLPIAERDIEAEHAKLRPAVMPKAKPKR
jgi:uncharacterized protein (DUF1778 family)